MVRLSAKAPVALDREWRLPLIRPQGGAWRSGQVYLRIGESLSLQHLSLHECGQTQTETLSALGGGRALTFRNYSPDARISLVAARRPSRVKTTAGSTIELGPTNASANLVFDLEAIQGERFVFWAEVAPEWIIDSLAAMPLEGPPEEDLLARETDPSSVQAGAPLEVRLKRSLNRHRGVRLVIKAHRRLIGPSATLTRQDLRVVEFRDVEETSRLIAVEPESPYQVALADDWRVNRREPSELPEHLAHLISASAAGIVFEDHAAAVGLRASLVSATPNFSAEIAMDVQARNDSLREKYRIRVTPISSRIDRVRVHFSARRSGELRWSWDEGPEQPLAARRIESELSEDGETWEVILDRARDSAVTLLAERQTEFAPAWHVSFASLPQATSQKGELVLRSTMGAALAVRTQGLTAVPFVAPGVREYPNAYGAYRFEPAQQPSARIVVSANPHDAPAVWARTCRVFSYYPDDGASHHAAVYLLENAGRASLALTIPAEVTLQRVEVNGRGIPLNQATVKSKTLRIPLPENERYPRVKIEYVGKPQHLFVTGELQPPSPSLEGTVLSREWFISTAPNVTMAAVNDGVATIENDPGWGERLLGFLHASHETSRPDSKESAGVDNEFANAPPEWIATPGWTTKRVVTTGHATPTLVVYRRDVFGALATCVFLLAVVGVVWLSSRRIVWFFVLGGVFAAMACVAPAPYYMLATALFLSIPTAATFRFFAARPHTRRFFPSADTASTTISVPVSLFVGAALALDLIGAPTRLAYAEPEAVESIYPVLVPLDQDGGVSQRDKYVYLPESLFEAFRKVARRLEAPPRAWLMDSVDYEVVCDWRPEGRTIGCERILVNVKLEVLSAPTRVVLPLPWGNVPIRNDSVRLDGDVLNFAWRQPEGGLAFDVEKTGAFELSLELTPPVSDDGARRRVELNVPSTLQAHVSVRYPADLDQVELASARGFISRDGAKGELTAELGPSELLAVSWPREIDDKPQVRRPIPVEQFLWLHVQPDALVLDAKWKFLGNGDIVSELEILADDNIQLLPSTARGLAGFTQVRRGDKQVLRLQLDQPRRTPFDFQVSMVVPGSAGVGLPAAPQVAIQKVDVARRWLAISLDPLLELRNAKTQHVEPLPEDRFHADWGDAPASPILAYRLLHEASSWSAEVRPRHAPTTGAAEVETVYRRDSVRVFYRADLDTGSDQRFVLRITAPKTLRVERVAVTERSVDRVDHWSQDDTGEIAIFLNGRVSGAFTLELQGEMPSPQSRKTSLPLLLPQDARITNTVYRVYRDTDLSLRITKTQGLTPVAKAPTGSYSPARGRLVAALAQDAEVAETPVEALLELSPNQPQITDKQLITTLTPANNRWIVGVELKFNTDGGAVDFVRFEMPQRMVGPFTIDPPARWETRELGQSRRQMLVVRPDEPLMGASRIRVTGFLHVAPGESLQAPEIEARDLGTVAQFLMLPREWREEPLTWETVGLRAEPLPDATPESDDDQTVVYRVVNKPRYGAAIRNVEHAMGEPQVRLMDVHVLLQGAGRYYAHADYDLEPAGMRACLIEMPMGTQLVHAAVVGRAITPALVKRNRYMLDLGGERLPVRLSVVYTGAALPSREANGGDDSATQIVSAPLLRGVPVERTLWSVDSQAHDHGISLVDSASHVSQERQELLRLRALGSILDLPSDTEAERSSDELGRWYAAWAQRWQTVRRRLASAETAAPSTAEASRAFESLDQEQLILARRYGGEDPREQTPGESHDDPAEHGGSATELATRAAFQGGVSSLSIHVERSGDSTTSRWLLAATSFLVACGLAVLAPRFHGSEWLARWFPMFCVALGLAWWLWLTPSAVGLAIAVFGLWFSFRGAAWIAPIHGSGLR